MYADIFAAIAPIFICALIGFTWARTGIPFEREFISRLVTNIGVPALVVGTLSKRSLAPEQLLQILGAASAVLLITTLLALALCHWLKLSIPVFLGSLIFPNTMNMGLPVSLFAFGEQGLTVALGIYLIVSLVHFTVGVALVSGERSIVRNLRSPMVLSGLAGVAVVMGDVQLPLWLQNTLDILGSLVIPCMLITLGVSLAQLRLGDARRSIGLGLARVALGFATGWLVAYWLELEGAIRGVVILQSAMPAAVFNYILAFKYQRSPEAVAGIVIASTLLSFLLLPAILWLVMS